MSHAKRDFNFVSKAKFGFFNITDPWTPAFAGVTVWLTAQGAQL